MLLYYLSTTIYNRHFNITLIPVTEGLNDSGSPILLPDGSKVYLDEESSIIYTKKFPADRRKIELRGGASIDIARDLRPFKMKIRRCLFISYEGKLQLNHEEKNTYRVLIEKGSFSIEEYNEDGDLENLYSKKAGDSIFIGNYVQVK